MRHAAPSRSHSHKPSVDLDSSSDDIKVIEIVSSPASRTVTSTCVPTSYSTSAPVTSVPTSYSASTPVMAKQQQPPCVSELKIPKSEPVSGAQLTPKCLFVRPFEDDYSPIVRPDSRSSLPMTSPTSSRLTTRDVKIEAMEVVTKVDTSVAEVVTSKVEDQDSDYESMSSDSSVKRESLCGDGLNKNDSYCDISLNKSDSFCLYPEEGYRLKEEKKELNKHEIEVEEDELKIDEDMMDMEGLTLCPTSGNLSINQN